MEDVKMTLNKGKTLDSKSQEQTMKQRQIWRQVLTWLLNVMKFLTKQNLLFRGHQDDVYSSNKSNFIELLKLMSQYDPVLGKHYLKEVNDNQWYLSPKIQNKFIHILGNHMKKNILDQNQKANYFVIILNSMPDISHTDQMSFICHYAIVEDKEVEVWESFLGFITEHGKTAYDIKKMILDRLEKEKLDFKKCRGIRIDNAANMARVHGGIQRLLQNLNGKAKFVQCSNHSLNLCGVHASAVNASAIIFFGVIERLYTFFFSSNHQWEALSSYVKATMKHLVTTCWGACYEAIHAVKTGFQRVIQALDS